MDIDIVIPWVDGEDPDWISEYSKYSNVIKKTDDARDVRFKEFGLLKYWFRSIERNAPWARKIHFITNGQIPAWLNLDHHKLNWVKHEDYIPEEYLPLFSSHPIEINMHKINGLSDHFVYFNDDTYLIKPVKADFFFSKRGLPLDCAIMNTITLGDIAHIRLNNLETIDKHFNKYTTVLQNIFKWYSVKYGLNLYRNFVLLFWKQFTGFLDTHLPQPFQKKIFYEVWDHCREQLSATSSSKFRSISDVNQYLFRYWQLCTGSFVPCNYNKRGEYFDVANTKDSISEFLKKQKKPMICVNDRYCTDSKEVYESIIDSFNSLFPDKSSFEL